MHMYVFVYMLFPSDQLASILSAVLL